MPTNEPTPKLSELLNKPTDPKATEPTGHKMSEPPSTKFGFPPFGRDLFGPAEVGRDVWAEPTGRDSAILGPSGGADARTDAETGRGASFEFVRAATNGKRAGFWWVLTWLLVLLLAALSASWSEMGGAFRVLAP